MNLNLSEDLFIRVCRAIMVPKTKEQIRLVMEANMTSGNEISTEALDTLINGLIARGFLQNAADGKFVVTDMAISKMYERQQLARAATVAAQQRISAATDAAQQLTSAATGAAQQRTSAATDLVNIRDSNIFNGSVAQRLQCMSRLAARVRFIIMFNRREHRALAFHTTAEVRPLCAAALFALARFNAVLAAGAHVSIYPIIGILERIASFPVHAPVAFHPEFRDGVGNNSQLAIRARGRRRRRRSASFDFASLIRRLAVLVNRYLGPPYGHFSY